MDWPLIHDFQGIERTHFMIDLDSMSIAILTKNAFSESGYGVDEQKLIEWAERVAAHEGAGSRLWCALVVIVVAERRT